MSARRVLVLGATGSIGVQTLDVIASSQGRLAVVGLAAGSSWRKLAAAAAHHNVHDVWMAEPSARENLVAAARSAGGANAQLAVHATLDELFDASRPDVVLNAVVGFAGLEATVSALRRGIDVALANKESLVAAGEICMELARVHGARIVPVDSEHSALAQCLAASSPDEVASLVLTASGGPFAGCSAASLEHVTAAEALEHPTWNMGGKISIDSATLMNKGLEVIEATVLFGIPQARVETVVHRQSIVHALVRHVDGSLLAHLGMPDMRVPISYALGDEHHHPLATAALDFAQMPNLSFEPPDVETFRCLALARAAADSGAGACCVLNAANEIAVEAFLAGAIRFPDIAITVERVLERFTGEELAVGTDLAAVVALDTAARHAARSVACKAA